MNTIFRTKFGSHLYGTDTPSSDLDFKSIHIPDAKEILLQRITESVALVDKKRKVEFEKNSPDDIDDTSHALHAFLYQLAGGQTWAIDMLFAPSPNITSDLMRYIQNNREKIITKKSASYLGYCRDQANKYGIKGSRMAACEASMNLFEENYRKRGASAKVYQIQDSLLGLTKLEHIRIISKETSAGNTETYFECCNRMVGFKNTIKEAYHIYALIYENYGERARKAKNNEGVDWKALSHAVRVGYEAIELLDTHKVTFPITNASHLVDIKLGKLSYEVVASEIEELLVKVESSAEKSTLRDEPDLEFVEGIILDAYGKEILDDLTRRFK